MSLPNKPLSNYDIEEAVKDLRIKKFRSVFMRDTLPKKPWKDESGILNFDDSSGSGTHWTAWVKRGNTKVYIDSFGLNPPTELARYLARNIHVNTNTVSGRRNVVMRTLCNCSYCDDQQ